MSLFSIMPRLRNRLLSRIQRHAGISTLFRRPDVQGPGVAGYAPQSAMADTSFAPTTPAGEDTASQPLVRAFMVPQPARANDLWGDASVQRTSDAPAYPPAGGEWSLGASNQQAAPWPAPPLPVQQAPPAPVSWPPYQAPPSSVQRTAAPPTQQTPAGQFVRQPVPLVSQPGPAIQRTYEQPSYGMPAQQPITAPPYQQQSQPPAPPFEPPAPALGQQQIMPSVQRAPSTPYQPPQPAPQAQAQPGQVQPLSPAPSVQRAPEYAATAQVTAQPAQVQPPAPAPSVQRAAAVTYQPPQSESAATGQVAAQPAQVQPPAPAPSVQRAAAVTYQPPQSESAATGQVAAQPSQVRPLSPVPPVQQEAAAPYLPPQPQPPAPQPAQVQPPSPAPIVQQAAAQPGQAQPPSPAIQRRADLPAEPAGAIPAPMPATQLQRSEQQTALPQATPSAPAEQMTPAVSDQSEQLGAETSEVEDAGWARLSTIMRRHEEQRAAGIQPKKAELKASAPWLQRLLDQGSESKGALRARARRPSQQVEPPVRPAQPPPRRRAGVLYLTPDQRHQNPMPPPPVPQEPSADSGSAPEGGAVDVDAGEETSQLQRSTVEEVEAAPVAAAEADSEKVEPPAAESAGQPLDRPAPSGLPSPDSGPATQPVSQGRATEVQRMVADEPSELGQEGSPEQAFSAPKQRLATPEQTMAAPQVQRELPADLARPTTVAESESPQSPSVGDSEPATTSSPEATAIAPPVAAPEAAVVAPEQHPQPDLAPPAPASTPAAKVAATAAAAIAATGSVQRSSAQSSVTMPAAPAIRRSDASEVAPRTGQSQVDAPSTPTPEPSTAADIPTTTLVPQPEPPSSAQTTVQRVVDHLLSDSAAPQLSRSPAVPSPSPTAGPAPAPDLPGDAPPTIEAASERPTPDRAPTAATTTQALDASDALPAPVEPTTVQRTPVQRAGVEGSLQQPVAPEATAIPAQPTRVTEDPAQASPPAPSGVQAYPDVPFESESRTSYEEPYGDPPVPAPSVGAEVQRSPADAGTPTRIESTTPAGDFAVTEQTAEPPAPPIVPAAPPTAVQRAPDFSLASAAATQPPAGTQPEPPRRPELPELPGIQPPLAETQPGEPLLQRAEESGAPAVPPVTEAPYLGETISMPVPDSPAGAPAATAGPGSDAQTSTEPAVEWPRRESTLQRMPESGEAAAQPPDETDYAVEADRADAPGYPAAADNSVAASIDEKLETAPPPVTFETEPAAPPATTSAPAQQATSPAIQRTAADTASPAPAAVSGFEEPFAAGPELTTFVSTPDAVDDSAVYRSAEPDVPQQPLPLEAVLAGAKREGEHQLTGLSAIETPEPGPPLLQRTPEEGEAAREVIEQVTTGQHSDAKVEFVMPRRARPAPPPAPEPVPGPAPPKDSPSSRPTPGPGGDIPPVQLSAEEDGAETGPSMVQTEIGALPSDLWALIGAQPPAPSDTAPGNGNGGGSRADVMRAIAAAETSARVEAPARGMVGPAPAMQRSALAGSEYIQPAEPIIHRRVAPFVQRENGNEGSEAPADITIDSGTSEEGASEPEINIQELARSVYAEIKRRLVAERERSRHRY